MSAKMRHRPIAGGLEQRLRGDGGGIFGLGRCLRVFGVVALLHLCAPAPTGGASPADVPPVGRVQAWVDPTASWAEALSGTAGEAMETARQLMSGEALGLHSLPAFLGREADTPEELVETGRRIIGGTETAQGEFPWLVHIGLIGGVTRRCAGVVVDQRWIMTASHCFLKSDSSDFLTTERVGTTSSWNTRVTFDCTELGTSKCRSIDVDYIHLHPCYAATVDQDHDDIALMHLVSDAGVQPAEINGQNFTVDILKVPGRTVYLAGWGAISEDPMVYEEKQKKVTVQTAPKQMCETQNPTAAAEGSIDFDAVVCTGGTPGRDSCKGDSGGPAIIPEWATVGHGAIVIGVLSKGSQLPSTGGCGVAGRYGVYTLTESYHQFIRAVTRAWQYPEYSCTSCPCPQQDIYNEQAVAPVADQAEATTTPVAAVLADDGAPFLSATTSITFVAGVSAGIALTCLVSLFFICRLRTQKLYAQRAQDALDDQLHDLRKEVDYLRTQAQRSLKVSMEQNRMLESNMRMSQSAQSTPRSMYSRSGSPANNRERRGSVGVGAVRNRRYSLPDGEGVESISIDENGILGNGYGERNSQLRHSGSMPRVPSNGYGSNGTQQAWNEQQSSSARSKGRKQDEVQELPRSRRTSLVSEPANSRRGSLSPSEATPHQADVGRVPSGAGRAGSGSGSGGLQRQGSRGLVVNTSTQPPGERNISPSTVSVGLGSSQAAVGQANLFPPGTIPTPTSGRPPSGIARVPSGGRQASENDPGRLNEAGKQGSRRHLNVDQTGNNGSKPGNGSNGNGSNGNGSNGKAEPAAGVAANPVPRGRRVSLFTTQKDSPVTAVRSRRNSVSAADEPPPLPPSVHQPQGRPRDRDTVDTPIRAVPELPETDSSPLPQRPELQRKNSTGSNRARSHL